MLTHYRQLQRVIQLADADSKKVEPGVGVLTADDRDFWHNAHTKIMAIPGNEKALERIQSSVFMVCLDDTKPDTLEDVRNFIESF